LSIAGGLHKALLRADQLGFRAVGMFVRNQRRWQAPPLSDEAARLFRETRKRLGIASVVAHGSYLTNLASTGELRRKSLAALRDELDRCRRCGIDYLVIHPGSAPDTQRAIARIADALNRLPADRPQACTKILLETTSGAARGIGGRFEQLAAILERLERPRSFGVCLDTCHVFAAGYDLRTPRAYTRTLEQFDRVIGLGRLLAVHLNDSRGPLGSGLDRHEHIGAGRIGAKGFANFVNDQRLAGIPMILETPKGTDGRGRDYDRVNAARLLRLARPAARVDRA